MRYSYMLLKSLVAIAVVAFAGTATAAVVYTDQAEYLVAPGETFFIEVLVDTEGELLSSWANLSTVNQTVAAVDSVVEEPGWASASQIQFPGGEVGVIGINFFGLGPSGPDIPLYQLQMFVTGEAGEETVLVQTPFPGTWNNQDGDPIEVTFLNPVIRVVPVPAAVWLFGSALGLLGWVRKRTVA